jgi:hypothetical protein
MLKAVTAIAIMLLPGMAWAIETQTREISFSGCLAVIAQVSGQYDAPPVNVVETSDLRIVKWFLSDGNVMVACSRPDGKMVVTKTAN